MCQCGRLKRGFLGRESMSDEDLVRPARFERATPAFGGQYSIQLSYGRIGKPWDGVDAILH